MIYIYDIYAKMIYMMYIYDIGDIDDIHIYKYLIYMTDMKYICIYMI